MEKMFLFWHEHDDFLTAVSRSGLSGRFIERSIYTSFQEKLGMTMVAQQESLDWFRITTCFSMCGPVSYTHLEYDALTDSMDDTMKEAISAEEWPEIWQPLAQQLGTFVEVEKHTIVGKDGMAVDVAQAAFENGKLTFTLSYDSSYRLAGLYMK